MSNGERERQDAHNREVAAREAQRAAEEREARQKHHDSMMSEIDRQERQATRERDAKSNRQSQGQRGKAGGCLSLLLISVIVASAVVRLA